MFVYLFMPSYMNKIPTKYLERSRGQEFKNYKRSILFISSPFYSAQRLSTFLFFPYGIHARETFVLFPFYFRSRDFKNKQKEKHD